jgi:penicillin-binding protein 1C
VIPARLAAAALAFLALVAVLLDRAFPPDLARLDRAATVFTDRDGRALSMFPLPDGTWRLRTSAQDVSQAVIDTLLATEDRHFWRHPGVNPLALARAALQDLRAGRVVSGGSTITMQAARLLEPRPRTIRAKLIEAARALQLEARFSKQQILGIWLTLAPMGGNLEGVRAGSLAWFGTEPRALEPDQAALLVAIPRRPEALRPDRHPDRARLLRDRVLAATGRRPADTPVPDHRTNLPRHARLALASLPRADTATTLSLPLQTALERLADTALASLPARASLAIVIADARTREVLALTSGGNARGEARGEGRGEARGEGRGGSLDLTAAVRSPGSALKPFIYGLAFQDGIIGPGTIVSDLPRRFGTYAPENFDRGFTGTVTAAEALRRSLNLPAVAVLDRLGPLRFAAAMTAAGARLTLPAHADPSLPLALGGAGIDLRHAAALYAALATDGTVTPLRLLPDRPPEARPLLSPQAAGLVASILTQSLPDGGRRGIAWKTGTSWGGRDAWALGFDRAWVVGAWVGRPDGTPVPGATGRGLAVPLMARAFDLLPLSPREDAAPVRPEPRAVAAEAADSLRLLFPPQGAVLSGDGPVTLRAMGGRRPLAFLVDGTVLPADPARREAAWSPQGAGFYRVTVIDAEGAAARASVRVR